MAITEAKQSGNRVNVKAGNSNVSFNGTLIGYTQKAVFIKDNRNLNIFVEKNGNVVSSGYNIALTSNDEVKMQGNCVGVQNGSTIKLYDENGRPAGTKRA